jgi:ribosomal protein S18 acetylase RimI-like enzyme
MEGVEQRSVKIVVRGLTPKDLDAVVAIDAKSTGRRREEYFRIKLQQNLAETGIKVSLAAEADGLFRGFLLARVYYGEFGTMEPVAVLDTVGVHPDTRGMGIGHALMEQLLVNLAGLGVATLRTEVAWEDMQLLAFFQRESFRPAARLCLELPITHRR